MRSTAHQRQGSIPGFASPPIAKGNGARKREQSRQEQHENRHSGKIAIRVGATDNDEGKHEDGDGAIWAEVGA